MEPATPKASWIKRMLELNPVLIRGVLVSVASLLAVVVGNTVISDDLIQGILGSFIAITALITALWSRGKVIAENKVVAWIPNPLNSSSPVSPGPATVPEGQESALVTSADVSMNQTDVRSAIADGIATDDVEDTDYDFQPSDEELTKIHNDGNLMGAIIDQDNDEDNGVV